MYQCFFFRMKFSEFLKEKWKKEYPMKKLLFFFGLYPMYIHCDTLKTAISLK